jgi:anti-sigma factor RsiW
MSNDPTRPQTADCEQLGDWLSAFQDNELPPDQRRQVTAHLATCATCRDQLADQERIGRSLRQAGSSAAPPALSVRLRAALDRVDREEAATTSPFAVAPIVTSTSAARPAWSLRGMAPRLATQVAAMAAACLVTALTTWWILSATGQRGTIERDLLHAHIRSLLQDSQVQVASSDQHMVRPWFAGRADFAPAVKDLGGEGFPLVGGRLDYIADRRAGVLVYKRRLHVINVFMWPDSSAAAEPARAGSRNGYNLLSWSRNGVAYAAVSDLNADELRLLQALL